MKTVADYLRNAPKGTKLYSPICGECTLVYVYTDDIAVAKGDYYFYFNYLGQYKTHDKITGECLLFPSKEVREWSDYQVPVHCDFKPFDKVVVNNGDVWHIDFFERYVTNGVYNYECVGDRWLYCLPFNEKTAKLIGTKDDYVR